MVMGESDVVIGKEEYKANCFNNQKSYDYGTSKKVLNGKQGSNERYTVKRIQVWHFVLSEEQKKQKEEEKTRQHEMFIKTISTERDQMNILSQNIISEFQYEIHQIEEWSELNQNQFCLIVNIVIGLCNHQHLQNIFYTKINWHF